MTSSQERGDVYSRVTDQIIQAIEAGAANWEMPWNSPDVTLSYPRNVVTQKPYRGVNVLSLWASAHTSGYTEATWGTFKQWSELGHSVRKGEKASIGVFWKQLEPGDQLELPSDETDAPPGPRLIARAFALFNAAQVEGYQPPVLPSTPEHERIEHAEAFFGRLGADIRNGGGKAYYREATDHIQMPPFEAFCDPIAYYSTLAHEATHWSGHPSRLGRDLSGRFGAESYAIEELIAELGAAFLAADLELAPDPRPENAAYIQSWLKVLRNDSRAIFSASGQAQRAADFMHGFQGQVHALTCDAPSLML